MMVSYDEKDRPTFTQLAARLPERFDLLEYYSKFEGKIDTRVFSSVRPGQGIDPSESNRVMKSSMKSPLNYQKKELEEDEFEVGFTEDFSQSDRLSRQGGLSMSRKTFDTGLERDFHAFVARQIRPLPPVGDAINRPVLKTHQMKHHWFQNDNGVPVYRDYVPPVYSINRIIPGQQHPTTVQEQAQYNNHLKGYVQDPTELNSPALLGDILKNFNQNDIKRKMNERFEKHLMAGKEDSKIDHTKIQPFEAEKEKNKSNSKYIQDYFEYNHPNKPRFKLVQNSTHSKNNHQKIGIEVAATIDRYSDISGIHNVGPGDESLDLADLYKQIR